MSIRDLRDLKNKIEQKVASKLSRIPEALALEKTPSGRVVYPVVEFSILVDFYYAMKKKHPAIQRCSIYIEDVARMEIGANYRIEQCFLDSNGNPVYADASHKELVGRIYLSKDLGETLRVKYEENLMKNHEHSVLFEI